MFRPGFTCLAVLWILLSCSCFHLRGSHTLWPAFPCRSVNNHSLKCSPYPGKISLSGLPSSAFARHYSQNHLLFSLPEGTEMFHFPSFPPTSLYIQLVVTNHDGLLGFPIRTSWDQRPVIGSPRLFADSHVLHRLLVPRHPPCALNNLHTDKIKDINLD